MGLAISIAQFKLFSAALGSLVASVQAFRASRSGKRLHLLFYVIGAAVLIYLTLVFLPAMVRN